MIRRWLVAVSLGLACLATPVAARNVLDAEPTVRIDSNADRATRRVLPPVERAKNRVIIIRQGEKYLWASRGGRELVHNASGAFHYFVDPLGSGYVKVKDLELMGISYKGPRYYFMEHVTIHLASITYWGASDRLDLRGEE